MHNLDIPMHNLSYNIRYLKIAKIFNQGHAHVTGPLSESLVPAQAKRRKDAIICKLGGMVGSLLHGTLARVPGPGGEKEEEKKEEEGEGRNRKIDLIVKNCGVLSVRVHAYCIQSHRAY